MSTPSKSMLGSNLEGQLLIAMPGITDKLFTRSVVYMCAHSHDGAMGLIINQLAPALKLGELLAEVILPEEDDLELDPGAATAELPVYLGGPVETTRGFVLHSPDYFVKDVTVEVTPGICLTATTDVLTAIAAGTGPDRSIVILGYAGWSPGQLESELAANGWLNCPADPDLVFADQAAAKYERALGKLGVDPSHLVNAAGRA